MTDAHDLDELVADRARRLVAAMHRIEDAEPGGILLAMIEHDAALHDLVAEVDGRCRTCEPGTCPLDAGVDADTVELDDDDEDVEDVVDEEGRI